MDFVIGLAVIGVVVFIAYKKVPAIKAKIDGFLSKE